jgi:hypothetical protein
VFRKVQRRDGGMDAGHYGGAGATAIFFWKTTNSIGLSKLTKGAHLPSVPMEGTYLPSNVFRELHTDECYTFADERSQFSLVLPFIPSVRADESDSICCSASFLCYVITYSKGEQRRQKHIRNLRKFVDVIRCINLYIGKLYCVQNMYGIGR